MKRLVTLMAALIGVATVTLAPQSSPVEARPCLFHSPHPSCPRTPVPPLSPGVPPPNAPAVPPGVGPPAPTSGVLFQDDFSSQTGMNRYDWQLFHGGVSDPRQLPDGVLSWWGDHSMACAPPATSMPPSPSQLREVHTHAATNDPGPVESIGEVAYWCGPNGPESGHFMTSLETVGYGEIDFSPAQPLENVRRICWDMSLNDVAGWWATVSVIPEATYQRNNRDLFYVSPAQQDEVARNGIFLSGEDFMLELARGSTHTYVGQAIDDPNFTNVLAIPGFPLHDRAKRYAHCVTDNNNGTVTVELYGRRSPTDVEVRTHQGSMPDGRVRVIFSHANYHNSKDTEHYDEFNGLGDELTVHWDNVVITS